VTIIGGGAPDRFDQVEIETNRRLSTASRTKSPATVPVKAWLKAVSTM
jgi:hypothetical protein